MTVRFGLNRSLRSAMFACAAGLLLIALAACGGGGSKAAFGDATKGKEVYTTTCAACHGPNAEGMTGLGKSLKTPTDWMKQQSDQNLLTFLQVGRPSSDPLNTTKVDMPPKGGNPALSEDDLKNVVAFIRTIQK